MTPDALVVWGAALGTFVASVMADDQSERLRNGAFGAVAGASLGGVAALFVGSKILVLYGVFGSAIGAGAAWLVYLILAFVAQKPAGRRMLEYHIQGLAGVHDQLIADANIRLREALHSWAANFARTIAREKDILLQEVGTREVNTSISLAIYNWLSTIVNTFNLVLDAIAETPLDYRCRATLIPSAVMNQVTGAEVIGSPSRAGCPHIEQPVLTSPRTRSRSWRGRFNLRSSPPLKPRIRTARSVGALVVTTPSFSCVRTIDLFCPLIGLVNLRRMIRTSSLFEISFILKLSPLWPSCLMCGMEI